jgi:hypothetical protein
MAVQSSQVVNWEQTESLAGEFLAACCSAGVIFSYAARKDAFGGVVGFREVLLQVSPPELPPVMKICPYCLALASSESANACASAAL